MINIESWSIIYIACGLASLSKMQVYGFKKCIINDGNLTLKFENVLLLPGWRAQVDGVLLTLCWTKEHRPTGTFCVAHYSPCQWRQ